jgi:hypothetical protein
MGKQGEKSSKDARFYRESISEKSEERKKVRVGRKKT